MVGLSYRTLHDCEDVWTQYGLLSGTSMCAMSVERVGCEPEGQIVPAARSPCPLPANSTF